MRPMAVSELMSKLLRPTYVLRMAAPMSVGDRPINRSAATRVKNAEREIHEIVMYYARSQKEEQ